MARSGIVDRLKPNEYQTEEHSKGVAHATARLHETGMVFIVYIEQLGRTWGGIAAPFVLGSFFPIFPRR
jgi:hypothetical protein